MGYLNVQQVESYCKNDNLRKITIVGMSLQTKSFMKLFNMLDSDTKEEVITEIFKTMSFEDVIYNPAMLEHYRKKK